MEATAAAVQQPVSAQVVGIAFVQQYYHILHHSPALLHRFYQDISKLGRPEDDGSMSITTTMTDINEKVLSLNYGEFRPEIKSVDAQESFNMGVHVLVTGYLTGKDNLMRNFVQSFFLAPQERGGYFVLNDMFRYVDKFNIHDENQVSVKDDESSATLEQGSPEAAPVLEDPIYEETNALSEEANALSEENNVLSEETNGEEVHIPSENGEIAVTEEEVSVAEVVNEVPDDSQLIVESNIKTEEVPKKSYASIVMDLIDSALPFSSPAPTLRKTPLKSQEQQVNPAPPSASLAEVSVSSLDAAENGNNQEGEADGYSIYIKGLPYNATPALLENEFKRFGTIKNDGIQVRSKQGFCFGFVEFEEASAVQKAIEILEHIYQKRNYTAEVRAHNSTVHLASPITLGGRAAVVEEKKSTNSRGNNRGRFPAGRGPGFRNEVGFRNDGMRGRGNYVGGNRGYSRGEFNGRTDFSNRGNNRGGSLNRGGDGYQRTESGGTNGSRVNRVGGLTGSGTAKNMAPRVPTSA